VVRVLVLAVLFEIAGSLRLATGEDSTPRVFTAAQAEAGRKAYDNSCGKCHTYSLLGRKGAEGELPPVGSLPAAYQEFIGRTNRVPPLAGKVFLSRWGQKTVAELIARFQITAKDPFFQFEDMTDDSVVNITAYALQMSGAKPGTEPLTRTTSVVVNSLVP
jgi:hypothetical protein